MKRTKFWLAGFAILLLWGLWCLFVLAQGMGRGPLDNGATSPSFALTGAFGDSFGAFSALMSALAVLGVVLTLGQSEENDRRQSFESSFFTLLSHFQQIVAGIDVHQTVHDASFPGGLAGPPVKFAQGRDALRLMLELLQHEIDAPFFRDSKAIFRIYDRFYRTWSDDLGHYFRTLYHIFRLIDERCPTDKTYYSRIVRAHLSQSELRLLAYNCSVGEGREKFTMYVRDYALLHNLLDTSDDFGRQERRFFKRRLTAAAFGGPSAPAFEY